MQLPQFLKRPPHTLLYITEVKTFRIDTDRKGIIKGDLNILDIACEKPGRLPAALEQIIVESEPLGRKVWILYARLDTYELSLPSVQVEGVDSEVLEQALQFEYEALTGNSLSKSQLAYQFLGSDDDMSHFWINLLASETLTDVMAVLKQNRCSLGGLGHPGGLPLLLSGDNLANWLRVECWPTTVFALSKTPERGFSLQILHKEQNTHWQDDINQWMLETGAVDKSEAIMNNQLEYIPATDENYRLTLDSALIFWMGQWAQHLIEQEGEGIPLLNKKVTINKELIYMVGSGAGALLLCVSHFTWMLYQTNHYGYEYEQLTQAEKELKSFRDGITKNQTELTTLQQDIATLSGNVDVIPRALVAFKKRPAELLKNLAENSPADIVIEDIKLADRQLAVTGVSMISGLSNQLASAIDQPLAKIGWKVNSPTKKDMGLFDEGGPWAFEILIDDSGLKGFIDSGNGASS
ncbi:MAG: hypothetical protein ACU85E_03780 [Gammaproteobacteria bacterium]